MTDTAKDRVLVFLKGVGMGAANVIPGVSGGTVAFITGIYERLIGAIKSFDLRALRLLFSGKLRQFAAHTDLAFLAVLALGILTSVLSLARVLKYLFARHEVLVWAFFFGLILASIIFMGIKVKRWSAGPIIGLVIGTAIAVAIALLKPASQNDSIPYLVLCGVIAMAAMIIPGISGSFVLLLLGNYRLIMIDSVAGLSALDPAAFRILVPVGVGALLGLVALSHLLAWIFKRFPDVTVALLTGFVAGSLLIIWPWKTSIVQKIEVAGMVREKVVGYEWHLPGMGADTLLAMAIMAAGFAVVWVTERLSGRASGHSAPGA